MANFPGLEDEHIRKSRREQRLRRFKQVPIRILVPNLITLLALCSGVTAIRLGMEGSSPTFAPKGWFRRFRLCWFSGARPRKRRTASSCRVREKVRAYAPVRFWKIFARREDFGR